MTTLPALIGFGGKPGSGKDTAADRLVDNSGFTKVNMSTAIAELTAIINPIVGRAPGVRGFFGKLERYNDVVARRGFTDAKNHSEVRSTLQNVGTGVRDVVDANVWADIAARVIKAHRDAGRPVVLSGVRYPNEADVITEAGGTLVWVARPGLAEDTNSQHAVENSISRSDFDVVIDNDGTVAELHAEAEALHIAIAGVR
ncbi:hypothetical protein FB472_2317 [Rhodoglobus vestalii]|uniref:Uncharacterized protein n=1 Tax=Rhodoglobus vestalii TaxID=193384 RepID=A0A8H2K9N0_9MICO|nr:hypothetical protein [Rhodoglobus vestalii]TQO20672.1 hypothetical protein FB472_2317 [Rhodoglobus vestalii]